MKRYTGLKDVQAIQWTGQNLHDVEQAVSEIAVHPLKAHLNKKNMEISMHFVGAVPLNSWIVFVNYDEPFAVVADGDFQRNYKEQVSA